MSCWSKIKEVITIQPKLTDNELFLKKVPFLKALTNKQLSMFGRFVHVRDIPAGEFIFKEDYPHVVVYFIKQGEVELLPHRDSEDPILKLKAYQYLGIEELFLDTQRWGSAVAKTNCVLLGISKYDFKTYIKRDPRAGIKILYGLCINFSRFIKLSLLDND